MVKLTEYKRDETGNMVPVGEADVDVDEERLKKYAKLFCDCDYLERHKNEHPILIEGHMGVNHGWICPGCRKFKQIG